MEEYINIVRYLDIGAVFSGWETYCDGLHNLLISDSDTLSQDVWSIELSVGGQSQITLKAIRSDMLAT